MFSNENVDSYPMELRTLKPWIPADRIASVVQIEPATVIFGLALVAWLLYKIFLRNVSDERHRNLNGLFRNLLGHTVGGAALFAMYTLAHPYEETSALSTHLVPYIGFLAIIAGGMVFVRTAKILMLEYLFLGHMREGVPVVLVNFFTFLLYLAVGAWIGAGVFQAKLTPFLATSAAFSLVIGLAMQDTLGNLFAGISLQFDKPYEIGDWIQVNNGSQNWVGQVKEVTWRATVLVAFTEELITIPNRIAAQAQISNYSLKDRPIARSQAFRIPMNADLVRAKQALMASIANVKGVRLDPGPAVVISETTESWITLKLVFYIDDYGSQYSIFDRVIESARAALMRAGIELAGPRVFVMRDQESA